MAENMLRIDVALIHYPVVNRAGEVTGSAITNLDLHDIARAGCTYGVDTYWVVTPDAHQQELAGELVAHWTEGYGGEVNPDRRQALRLIEIRSSLVEVMQAVTEKWQARPTVFATCACPAEDTVRYGDARHRLHSGESMLLLFGTAWGLAPDVMAAADATLPPLRGYGTFNHLSVRSAVSIVLDRLLGQDRE